MATHVELISSHLASFYDFTGKVCLFVGAGSRIALAPARGSRRVLVVDRDPRAIARVREELVRHDAEGRVDLRVALFEDVEETFDVVYLEFCLHEMRDPDATLRKAKSTARDVIVLDHALGSEWMHCAGEDEDVRRASQALDGFHARRRARHDAVQSFADGDELSARLSGCGPLAASRASRFAGDKEVTLAMPYELILL
jgi:SAM-dependent methyltransferase